MAAWLLWPLTALPLVAAVFVPLYRLFLHPLASIPGPPLAAITRLYAFYFNVIQGGKFYLEIERLHHVYGTQNKQTTNSLFIFIFFMLGSLIQQPRSCGPHRAQRGASQHGRALR